MYLPNVKLYSSLKIRLYTQSLTVRLLFCVHFCDNRGCHTRGNETSQEDVACAEFMMFPMVA